MLAPGAPFGRNTRVFFTFADLPDNAVPSEAENQQDMGQSNFLQHAGTGSFKDTHTDASDQLTCMVTGPDVFNPHRNNFECDFYNAQYREPSIIDYIVCKQSASPSIVWANLFQPAVRRPNCFDSKRAEL